jgi:hypothetical protein
MGRTGDPGQQPFSGLRRVSPLHLIFVRSSVDVGASTDMNQGLRDDPERRKYYENLVMLKRISDPHEQAGQVVFLLSDYSSCESSLCIALPRRLTRSLSDITGTDIIVDGGVTAW